eukprot:2925770-Prymnesium_polylepis.1
MAMATPTPTPTPPPAAAEGRWADGVLAACCAARRAGGVHAHGVCRRESGLGGAARAQWPRGGTRTVRRDARGTK